MTLLQPGRGLRLGFLPILCLTVAATCHARPQESSTSADTNAQISSSPINPDGKHLENEDIVSASGAWRPVVSRTSPISEHQHHTDQERSRYNTNIWTSEAKPPRPSSINTTIQYPLLDTTHRRKVLTPLPEEAVYRNLSIARNGNIKNIYLNSHTRRGVNASKIPLFLNENEPSRFNWKQGIQLPAATRNVLSRIISYFNGSIDHVNKSISTNETAGGKPKRVHFVPLGLFSALSRNAHNVSSQLHKILLDRLKNRTNSLQLHGNSTAVNKIKGNDSFAVVDEGLWSPVALTSSRLSTNESFKASSHIKGNSSKKLGGTKKYSVLTSFNNSHEAYNGTYLVHVSGNNSAASNRLNVTNLFVSNSSELSDAASWIPVLQPAKGDSKLLNRSILAEPENITNYDIINTDDKQDPYLRPLNTTTSSRKSSHIVRQNNLTSTGSKKSKLSDTFPDNSKLVNTFLTNNMQDLHISSNKYPNKWLENVDEAEYSGTISPPEKKKWPGGTSGIESLDDLILYHTYTNGLKEKPKPTAWTPQVAPSRPTVTMHQQPGGGYVGIIKKPAVTIHNSQWDYPPSSTPPPEDDQNSTGPSKPSIILGNKPHISKPAYSSHYPNHRPTYGGYKPEQESSKPPSPTMYPVILITPRPTPAHKPSTPSYLYPSTHVQITTPHPPGQTSQKPSNCPNIFITTNGNVTAGGKEGCPDVNIMITSGVTNNNVVVSGPPTTTQSSVAPLSDNTSEVTAKPKPPGLSIIGNGILSSVTSAVSYMLNPLQYPLLYFMLAPVMVIMAGGIGIAALLFPWSLGWRSGRKARLEKKATSYPQPKPRRRRSFSYVNYFPEDIVLETVMEFERNMNTVGIWKHSDILTSASMRVKMGMTRRKKRNDSLNNYYWWWLKSDT